jgi:uncharacterized membrane protein
LASWPYTHPRHDGRGQRLAPAQFKKKQMIVRVEMTLLLLAPFFATWMAHGDL